MMTSVVYEENNLLAMTQMRLLSFGAAVMVDVNLTAGSLIPPPSGDIENRNSFMCAIPNV